jgi:hypothetical protein
MGRIRLAGVFFASFALLLCVSQEAAAQSLNPSARTSEGRGEPASIVRPPLPRPRPTPRGPEIFYCETPDTSCRTTQDTFPIADLRDLFVFVTWPGVSGQHIQTVQFFLPDGSVYSSQKARFSVGGGPIFSANVVVSAPNVVAPPPPAPHLIADANKTHAEGIPSLLMRSRGDSAVLTVLPVAGTYITQRNLSGVWRVRILLDDRLALESEFTLAPRQPAHPVTAKDEAEL